MRLTSRSSSPIVSRSRSLPVLAVALVAAVACGGAKSDASMAKADSTAAPAPAAAAPAPAAPAPAAATAPARTSGSSVRKNDAGTAPAKPKAPTSFTLASGTMVPVTIRDSITSRRDTTGVVLSAVVASDVKDERGNIVIAAGSPVAMHIAVLTASPPGDTKAEGKIDLAVTSITVGKSTESVDVHITDVPHKMVGRGVTKGQVTDVAVGTAIGALAGRLAGKSTKATVVGGAAGAVAGGVVAAKGAQSDVVVAPGTQVSFALPRAVTYTP